MPNFPFYLFFPLFFTAFFLRCLQLTFLQTQSEPINGVTHTPRKPRCQRLAASAKATSTTESAPKTKNPLRHSTTSPHLAIHYVDVVPAGTKAPSLSSLVSFLSSFISRLYATPPLDTWAIAARFLGKSLTAALAAALYAHGVFIKVVFILRDIFGAFSLYFPFFFFSAPNNKILLTIFSPLLYQSRLHSFCFAKLFTLVGVRSLTKS